MNATAANLRRRLLTHYDVHARDLPWRRTRDPYRIWISEVMLQQTRAAVAAERYAAFLRRFPDVESLARASALEVSAAWAGLGYYSRARNLHAAARHIQRSCGRCVPQSASELRRLPGIGVYTAGAIASIAFGETEPALDTNARRVVARVLASRNAARVRELALALVRCERPGDVNQALMDVGAQICTRRKPQCRPCPLRPLCRGSATGHPERFPAERRRVQRLGLDVAFVWVHTRSGVWLERRPLGGLWSGLWQLPGEAGPRARARLSERLGVDLGRVGACVSHVLTHREVRARVYAADGRPRLRRSARLRPFVAPLQAPLSALARKAIVAACAAPLFRSGT